ncbi:Na+/H+ antiporter NhaA [Geminicoccus harenae]|uniref:Na+/H+ antiporter NhaA n=1 Tax=Geminicoccus harenae TaxID=2498453 RepID=UPI001C978E04|nr:Na+/H+ antiporter NhaA [Geminicoccus harenae]
MRITSTFFINAHRYSYLVIPLFALANSGVVVTLEVFKGHAPLMMAIIMGLVIGKPVGFLLATSLAVRFGIAVKPDACSWRHLAGAGALAGIGFTMSLFIAGEALPVAADFAAAKIAVFIASILAAVIGMAVLWNAGSPEVKEEADPAAGAPDIRHAEPAASG